MLLNEGRVNVLVSGINRSPSKLLQGICKNGVVFQIEIRIYRPHINLSANVPMHAGRFLSNRLDADLYSTVGAGL